MDNKLSELSKPVAWKLHYYGQGHYFEENAYVVALAESMGKAKGDALYSQEYVSALLEEIGEKERSLISNCVDYEYDLIEMKRRAEAAEQRVAELEQAMKEQSNG